MQIDFRSIKTTSCLRAFVVILLFAQAAFAGNASQPVGEPVLERPTMLCLGAYWIIRGDDNKNAVISVDYRKSGSAGWRKAMPLFRVEKGADAMEKYGTTVYVPKDAWLFAGSVVMLDPDTAYELRLTLKDPDGGSAERILSARTRGEPKTPPNAHTFHVVPGFLGGSGTAQDPFQGLTAAQANAKPGDVFLLHAGVYEGTFTITKSGESNAPIAWRGAGDGEAVIDAQGKAGKRPGRGISATEVHDVWFENLSVRNADFAIVAHESARIVVRRCHMYNVDYGLTATKNSKGELADYFVSDNLIEGPCTWPRTRGIEDPRGIQITGEGHVVCYNRVRNFGDGIDTFPSPKCAAIDFHNNDISECTDDGSEMDYSQRNTRNFNNRYTNVFQGVSVQPVFGGPVYIFRNTLFNLGMETFKMHNSPSGAIFCHNTSVKAGMPLMLATNEKVRNCVLRNNLFIGTRANYAYECMPKMIDCDFDYDGFGGGPFGMLLKWNGARYATIEDVRTKSPVEKHSVLVDAASAFASGVTPPQSDKKQLAPPDLRLAPSTAAIDVGQVLPNFNDDFTGRAPDLGALELDKPVPHYGPRNP